MPKVVTFGELMLRLTPPKPEVLLQTSNLLATFGGSEANVAVSLANYGEQVSFVSAFSDNEIGDAAESQLLSFKVDTRFVKRTSRRMGIYYMEMGSNMRPSKVIYDREHSAISYCGPEDFDWEKILDGADWFFFSGITPAISSSLCESLGKAITVCKKNRIKVVCDLNFRTKLWNWGRTAVEVMPEMISGVDVLIGNEEDIQKSLGIHLPSSSCDFGHIDPMIYRPISTILFERYPQLSHIAVSLRESISANYNRWSGLIANRKTFLVSSTYEIGDIADRLGSGDSFSAGLIHGLCHFTDLKETIEFAVAASALKHTFFGDYNRVGEDDVFSLMKGNASGRVQR